MNDYYIKEGYKLNIVDGKPKKTYKEAPPGTKYQISVFKYIRDYVKKNLDKIEKVVDLGCGSAYKLDRYLSDFGISISAVDQSFAVEVGRNRYPNLNWITDDFEKYESPSIGSYDVIISSDVIEHLVHPEILLNRIKNCSHSNSIIFISTPERDLVRGKDSYGPPENIKHVREWNKFELANYLQSEGFKIIDHIVLPARTLSLREKVSYLLRGINNTTCQLVVCKLAKNG